MKVGHPEDKFDSFDEVNKTEVEVSDSESYGLIDEELMETEEKGEIQTDHHDAVHVVQNESSGKEHPCVQINEDDVSAILDKECELEGRVFR